MAKPGTFSDFASVSAARGVVSCDLAGGAALLDQESGVYFTLNNVGAYVWTTIQEPRSMPDIVNRVTDRFSVDRATASNDVSSFLRQLNDAGLVTFERPGD